MSNNKRIYLLISFCALTGLLPVWHGCTVDEKSVTCSDPAVADSEAISEESNVLRGVVRVKFDPDFGEKLYREDPTALTTALRSIGASETETYLSEIGAKSMTRVFPNTGKYDERKRKAGLHLWYDIEFDGDRGSSQVASEMQGLPGVVLAEAVPVVELPDNTVLGYAEPSLRAGEDTYFNDPMLSLQWHYQNSGDWIRHKKGADINLYKAWEIETGKPNVVVAVIDAGVDLNHEDLKENIYWENPGYNFVDRSEHIVAQEHGTHVAGTVAARNHNGIGVSGVAGGDGSQGSGVKLMSCQIFNFKKGKQYSARNFGEPFVYAADHGAHIAQNSWGVSYPGTGKIDPATKEAIDYFIKYAGCDDDGNQLPDSPMKGGVVIFAAGNDGKDYLSFPAAYEPVVSVAAFSPDYTLTAYSNRGGWVDIAAPGGNINFQRGAVLSTLPGNKYGYMQGTSMACPHVSGIAALIVSKFGRQGFTNEELKARLINSVSSHNIDALNPEYSGRMGNGYIDAAKALDTHRHIAPARVEEKDISVNASLEKLQITFPAVADEDDGTAANYYIYISKYAFNEAAFTDEQPTRKISAHHIAEGEKISVSIPELDFVTTYHIAIISEDRWGLRSAPTIVTATTATNSSPVLTLSTDEPLRVVPNQSISFGVLVNDPEELDWTFQVEGDLYGVDYQRAEKGVDFKITGNKIGKYTIRLVVEDHYFASSVLEIPYEVYANGTPQVVKKIEPLYLSRATQIYVGDLFADPDADELHYSCMVKDAGVADLTIDEAGKLSITPKKIGHTYIKITATDPYGAEAVALVPLSIAKDELIYSLYPVPATTDLFMVVSERSKKIDLTISTFNGIKALEQSFSFTTEGSHEVGVDLRELPMGTYILKVVDENGNEYKTTFSKL